MFTALWLYGFGAVGGGDFTPVSVLGVVVVPLVPVEAPVDDELVSAGAVVGFVVSVAAFVAG